MFGNQTWPISYITDPVLPQDSRVLVIPYSVFLFWLTRNLEFLIWHLTLRGETLHRKRWAKPQALVVLAPNSRTVASVLVVAVNALTRSSVRRGRVVENARNPNFIQHSTVLITRISQSMISSSATSFLTMSTSFQIVQIGKTTSASCAATIIWRLNVLLSQVRKQTISATNR